MHRIANALGDRDLPLAGQRRRLTWKLDSGSPPPGGYRIGLDCTCS